MILSYSPAYLDCRNGYAIETMAATVSGGTADQFEVSPSTADELPAGLAINAGTGAITGTPTAATGFLTVTILATNTETEDTATTTVKLIVRTPGDISIPEGETVKLATDIARTLYVWSDNTFFAPDAEYTWSPALPAWATWTVARKRLVLTPTEAGSFGPYTLSDGTRSLDVTFTVEDPIDITTSPWPVYYGTATGDSTSAARLVSYLNQIAGSTVFSAATAAPAEAPSNAIVVGTVSYWNIGGTVFRMVAEYNAASCFHMAGKSANGTAGAVALFMREFLGCKFWCAHHTTQTDVTVGSSFEVGDWDETIPSSETIEVPKYSITIDHMRRVDLAWGEGVKDIYANGLSVNIGYTYLGGSHGGHTIIETYRPRYGDAVNGWFDAYPVMVGGFACPVSSTPVGKMSQGDTVTFSGGGSGVFDGYGGVASGGTALHTYAVFRSVTRLPASGETITGTGGSVTLTGNMLDQGLPALVDSQAVTGTFIPHEPLTFSQSEATARLAKHVVNGSYYVWLKDVSGTPEVGDVVTGTWSSATLTLAGPIIADATKVPLFYRSTVDDGDPFTSARARGKFQCYTAPELPAELASVWQYQVSVVGVNPATNCLFFAQEDTASAGHRCKCSRCEAIRDADPTGGAVHTTLTPLLNATAAKMQAIDASSLVGAYAYQGSFPPAAVAPIAGVVIRVAPITVNTETPVCDYHGPHECEYNETFSTQLSGWGTHAATTDCIIDGWSYAANFSTAANFFSLRPVLYMAIKQNKAFYAAGAKGMYFQSIGGPYQPLQLYAEATIAIKPWMHEDDIVEEFINGYYGDAAANVLNTIQSIQAQFYDADDKPINDGANTQTDAQAIAAWWTTSLLTSIKADKTAALAAVSGNTEYTSRVNQFYLPMILSRDGIFVTPATAAQLGAYEEALDGATPVIRRVSDGYWSWTDLYNFARDGSRSSPVNEYADGILARWEPVRNGGARRITLSLNDLAVEILPEWNGLIRSIKRNGTELLHQGSMTADGLAGGYVIWPMVPGSLMMAECTSVVSDLPSYLRWKRSVYGELVSSTATSATVRWREGMGDWSNSGGYGNMQYGVYELQDTGSGHAKLVVTFTCERGVNTRYAMTPVVETRWVATDTESDSEFVSDVASKSYSVTLPSGVVAIESFSDGLGMLSGAEFNTHFDATGEYLSVQAYFAAQNAAYSPGTVITQREILFRDPGTLQMDARFLFPLDS